MNKHMRLRAAVVLVGLLALTFGVGTAVADAPFGSTIATDQPDYVPGSTVYVTGAGWAIGETVHIGVPHKPAELVFRLVQAGAKVAAAANLDAFLHQVGTTRIEMTSVESVLAAMKERGAYAKLAVIDASRRNPYERRFRSYSHGLAPINSPDNALILSSATPGKVADDSRGQNSVLVTELLNNIAAQGAGIESVFKKTRIAISRASDGEQVPSVSSSLAEDLPLGATETTGG